MQLLRKIHKKIPGKKPEYAPLYILRLASLVIAPLVLATAIFVIYFIYQTVFTTVGQAQAIIYLQKQLGTDVVDFDRYEKVEAKWQEKINGAGVEIEKDPFSI